MKKVMSEAKTIKKSLVVCFHHILGMNGTSMVTSKKLGINRAMRGRDIKRLGQILVWFRSIGWKWEYNE